jgi:hypothetical protein
MYDIYFDLANMHRTVNESDKDDSDDDQFAFEFELDLPEEDDRAVIVRKPQTCKQCQEIYPYAEPNQKDGTFKCYSCRIWG